MDGNFCLMVESTENWRGYGMDEFPAEGWVVEDSFLVFRAPESGSSGLDIITKETYEILSCRWSG